MDPAGGARAMTRAVAVGIGSRSGVSADAVVAAVRDAVAGLGEPGIRLYTLDRRASEPGLLAAAGRLGTEIVGLPETALRARAGEAVTRSARAEAAAGVPSVAETAALAGAGQGSRLLVPRRTGQGVTVAVAGTGEET
jgi:cobalt-precorrin 5A hydrolase